jgi:hypothetical protein
MAKSTMSAHVGVVISVLDIGCRYQGKILKILTVNFLSLQIGLSF